MNSILKKSTRCFILIYSLIGMLSCSNQESVQISVTNPTNLSLTDVFVTADIDSSLKLYSVYEGEKLIPSQVLTLDKRNEIGFVLNLEPSETKNIVIKPDSKKPEFKSRTYAELAMKQDNIYSEGRFRGNKFVNVTNLRVPAIHTDHDALFKYEGPGWESEKVGYRFYLD